MRALCSIVCCVAMSGCATYHGPKPQVPTGTGSTDWSTVGANAKGHYVFVTLDGGDIRRGLFWCIADATLTIRDEYGEQTLPRAGVVRIAKRVQTGTKRSPWYTGVPIAAGVLGGLTGFIVGTVQKNAKVQRASLYTFWFSTMIGIGLGKGDSARPVFEDRLVYVRP